jgi:hypothetical protein
LIHWPRRPWRTVEREPERVSRATLAAHLDMTRQNVARLTAEGILERTRAGYLMDDSRRRYIRHLREEYRRSPEQWLMLTCSDTRSKLL